MSLNEDVDLEEFVMTKDDLSGADIKAVCTEAGLLALRERRMRVTKADFTTAREKVSSSCRFTTIFSLPFIGIVQKERRYSGRALLVDVWSCVSRRQQSVSLSYIMCLGYSFEAVKLCENTTRKVLCESRFGNAKVVLTSFELVWDNSGFRKSCRPQSACLPHPY